MAAVAVALTLNLLGSLGGVALLTGRAAGPAPTAAPGPPTAVREAPVRDLLGERVIGVRALLERRASALRDRNREAFLATVSPTAVAFQARQAALFDALAEVPLARWDYELDPAHERSPDPRLDARYGFGAWWAPDVILRYALRDFDREATYARQRLTFVRTGDAWTVASDDDFAAGGEPSARGLWDGGPVQLVRGEHTLVLGHPGPQSFLREVAAEVDLAVTRVTAVWGTEWAQSVVVLVPNDQQELSTILGPAVDLTRIAAVATAELPDVPGGYRPVGDRIMVNPPNFAKLGKLGRSVVLSHEVTHVATRQASGPDMPTWLAEGFADYLGYLDSQVGVATATRELRTDVRAGRVPVALPADADFAGSSPTLAQAYEQSWLAVRLIVERYGQDEALRFYRAVGASRGSGAPAALERGFTGVLGTTTAAFTATWRESLVRTLS